MLRPVRFTTASAPSRNCVQSPGCSPSQTTSRTSSRRARDRRVSTMTSSPRSVNSSASAVPIKPLPPAMTIRFALMAESFLKFQSRPGMRSQRIYREPALLQPLQPVRDQSQHRRQIKPLVTARIFFQVRLRQFEQRGGRTQAAFLQMHKRAGQLDETFVKISIRALTVGQPQIFQHVVRLIKKAAVEAVEIAEIMRVQFLSPKGFDHRGNAGALVAHGFRI